MEVSMKMTTCFWPSRTQNSVCAGFTPRTSRPCSGKLENSQPSPKTWSKVHIWWFWSEWRWSSSEKFLSMPGSKPFWPSRPTSSVNRTNPSINWPQNFYNNFTSIFFRAEPWNKPSKMQINFCWSITETKFYSGAAAAMSTTPSVFTGKGWKNSVFRPPTKSTCGSATARIGLRATTCASGVSIFLTQMRSKLTSMRSP